MALPISYHWRHLFVRKTTTAATILVVAAVVGVFTWMLSFAAALNGSLAMASDARKIIVTKRGATAESNSAITPDEFNRLSQVADVAVDAATGEPMISPEMLVQVTLPRLRDGGRTTANVAVRGVTANAFKVHRNVQRLGRSFSTGEPEVIVGMKTAQQFGGLELGDSLNLGYGGNRGYKVVGFFTADGGPMESEIWGYLPSLMNSNNRKTYSSANLVLREGANPEAAIAQIEGPAVQLTAQTETQYWQAQSKLIRVYLGLSYVLVGVMSVAAIFSIANTMFSTVAGRTREIAMLRTIGFTGGQILSGFVLEAVLLALLGGVTGCLAGALWLTMVGHTKDMHGQSTFTTMAFDIKLTPMTIVWALSSVVLVGVLGALWPARRAACTAVVSALREP